MICIQDLLRLADGYHIGEKEFRIMAIYNAVTAYLVTGAPRALMAALLAFGLVGCASPQRTENLYPVSEADGLMASGYAVIASQRGDTPAQQRLMAIKASKLDAYRALAEQVYGQYINATGTMNDMSVTEDHLKSRVEGVIYGARVVSITPIGEETYETKLALPQRTIDELVKNYLQGPSAGR
jgi:hypothetical protein